MKRDKNNTGIRGHKIGWKHNRRFWNECKKCPDLIKLSKSFLCRRNMHKIQTRDSNKLPCDSPPEDREYYIQNIKGNGISHGSDSESLEVGSGIW